MENPWERIKETAVMEDESRRQKGKWTNRTEKIESAEIVSSSLLTNTMLNLLSSCWICVFTQVHPLWSRWTVIPGLFWKNFRYSYIIAMMSDHPDKRVKSPELIKLPTQHYRGDKWKQCWSQPQSHKSTHSSKRHVLTGLNYLGRLCTDRSAAEKPYQAAEACARTRLDWRSRSIALELCELLDGEVKSHWALKPCSGRNPTGINE